MLDLTKQERTVLISLIFVFLIGVSLHFAFKNIPAFGRLGHMLNSDKAYSQIDLNAATYDELLNLPFVGPVTAANIIAYRNEHGPFQNIEELRQVKNIGKVYYKKIVKFLKILPKG